MADWGTIGMKVDIFRNEDVTTTTRRTLRSLVVNQEHFSFGGRDNTQGDPAQPSLRMDARGVWRFRWVVATGSREVSVNVKQAVNLTPRPTLVVKANTAIGVNSDVTGTAASSTGWVTIGPVAVVPSSDGALWVELHANYDGQYKGAPCYWDHVVVT